MANEKNLIPFDKRSETEVRELGRKGGKASGETRMRRRLTRELITTYDGAPLNDEENAALDALGMPKSGRTAKLRRVLALLQKAETGDVQANKLILETLGERDIVDDSTEMSIGFTIKVEDFSDDQSGDNVSDS